MLQIIIIITIHKQLAKRFRFILAIISNKEHNEVMKYDCTTYVQESFLQCWTILNLHSSLKHK